MSARKNESVEESQRRILTKIIEEVTVETVSYLKLLYMKHKNSEERSKQKIRQKVHSLSKFSAILMKQSRPICSLFIARSTACREGSLKLLKLTRKYFHFNTIIRSLKQFWMKVENSIN